VLPATVLPAAGQRGVMALRVAGAAAVGGLAFVVSGWSPGAVGVLAGVLTWLLVSTGHSYSRHRSH
jgi:hypothetical protein